MLINLIDSIFNPVEQFLRLCIDKLAEVGTVAAKGIRLDHYFGFFAIIGPEFSALISSMLAAVTFIFILYMVQKYNRVLLWFKALIKWW